VAQPIEAVLKAFNAPSQAADLRRCFTRQGSNARDAERTSIT
jgi:hypothetical protein